MTLKIPSFLYGPYGQVSRTCARKIKALAAGVRFDEIVESWLDVESKPGLLVLEGPSATDGRTSHFQCFALTHVMTQAWSLRRGTALESLRARWLTESLEAPWSFLGLLCQDGRLLLNDARLLDFLKRASAYWPDLHAVGERYSYALLSAEPLERVQTSIDFALACQGVSLRGGTRMGPDGPHPLLMKSPGHRIRELLASGNVLHATVQLRALNDPIVVGAAAEHFIGFGLMDVAVRLIREIRERIDHHGLLAERLSEYAERYVDAATPDDLIRACVLRGGFPNWKRLVRLGPADGATRVITELEHGQNWNGLMKTLIHHTRDFERALSLWDARAATTPEIRWAAEQLADGIADRLPSRAAEMYVMAAEAHVAIGKRHIYRQSAALISKAYAVLRSAGIEERGRAMVAEVRYRHRRRRLLLDAISAEGL